MNSNFLNKTDEYYFHKIIETLNLRGFIPELIISYLLLELKENEIVYITLIDKWYLYDYETKKWNEYDFKITISKVCQLYETFKIKFINYIETKKDELTEKNYLRLKYFANKIADNIYNNELNKTVIYNKCKSLFTIV
jgi:hypothetical protein